MPKLDIDGYLQERLDQVRANLIKAEFLGSGFPPLDVEQLTSIEKPILFLSGQTSPAFYHRLLDRLQELLPHAKRVEIPQASHIIHEDNALFYNATVLPFLREQQT